MSAESEDDKFLLACSHCCQSLALEVESKSFICGNFFKTKLNNASSKSSPPSLVSPDVDLTSNTPMSLIAKMVTSKVPPPRSYTKIV